MQTEKISAMRAKVKTIMQARFSGAEMDQDGDWSVPFDEFPRPPPISLNLADEPEQPKIGQVRARESERGACV